MTLDHVALLRDAVRDMTAALADADPRAAVPACPDWTVTDLAHHLGDVHRWAASILLTGTKQAQSERWYHGDDLPRWYATAATALLAAIEVTRPDDACWNFAPVEQRAGFWRRRQLHETVVHTVDARQAAGTTREPAAALEADGVDEVFGVFLPRMLQRGYPPAVTVPVSVAADDTGDVWTLVPVAGGPPQVRREPGDVVAHVHARAADLYLALWRRVPAGRPAIEGDETAGRTFLAGALTP